MKKQPESAMHGQYQGDDRHEQFRDLLPEFAMVCIGNGAGGPEWEALETHLDSCDICRKELEDLLQLLDDTYAGTLEAETEVPIPDLAYLPPWSSPERPHDLVAIVHTVTAAIQQVFIQFTETLAYAMRQPEAAGLFRSSGPQEENYSEEEQPLPNEYTYQIRGSSPDDLAVAVDFALIDVARQLYSVKVTVIDQEQDPFSQDGHQVSVHYEAQTMESVTDTTGCASFPDIPYSALPHLQITINVRSTT